VWIRHTLAQGALVSPNCKEHNRISGPRRRGTWFKEAAPRNESDQPLAWVRTPTHMSEWWLEGEGRWVQMVTEEPDNPGLEADEEDTPP
jgi:hypothetical protein